MDWVALFEPMNSEMEQMMRANARLWVGHDEDTAKLGDEVVVAAGRAIGAVTASAKGAQPRRLFRSRQSSQRKAEEAVAPAVDQMMNARNALAKHARQSLGLPTATEALAEPIRRSLQAVASRRDAG